MAHDGDYTPRRSLEIMLSDRLVLGVKLELPVLGHPPPP